MMLKRGVIILIAAMLVLGFMMGFGRDAFVGNVSISFGTTAYDLSVGAVAVVIISLIGLALVALAAIRRCRK